MRMGYKYKPRTYGSDAKDDVESKKCVPSSNFGYLVVSSQARQQESNSYQIEAHSPRPQITLQLEELKLRWTTHR
jgi:hypothetical protein